MRNFVQILRKVFLTLGHTAQALLSSQMKLFAAIRHPKKMSIPCFKTFTFRL